MNPDCSNTLAIILAAGMGTRLGKYTENLPKGMLPFLGKSLIERQIETLRSNGIEQIAIVGGYCADKLNFPNCRIFTNPDFRTTNMVVTLGCARPAIEAHNGPVLVSYADIIYQSDTLIAALDAEGDIAVTADLDWIDYWKARSDSWLDDVESLRYSEQTSSIIEIGQPRACVESCMARYVGLLRFSPKGIRAFLATFDKLSQELYHLDTPWRYSRSLKLAYMTCMLQEMVDRGCAVRIAPIRHGWLEFDTVEDYERALQWHEQGTLKRFFNLRGA